MNLYSVLSFMYVLSSSTFVDGREFQHVNAHKCKTGNKDLTTKMKKVASVDDCQALCYAQDSCLGYDYTTSKELCLLLDFYPTLQKKSGAPNRYCGRVTKNYFMPFIQAHESSKRVTIPYPDQLKLIKKKSRKNCPHLEEGLLDWHDRSTWPNREVPRRGENANLPENSRVLIERDAVDPDERLNYINIPSTSELIIGEDSRRGVLINAKGINVEGALTAGSEKCPIFTKVKIKLFGKRPKNAVTKRRHEKVKGINVDGGILSLHGEQFHKTWTRLAKRLEVGDSYALLQHSVNWKKGQQAIIVSTAMLDNRQWHENEILEIDFVSEFEFEEGSVGSIVYFKSPIQKEHIANYGYQGEIGLLTRSIVISGAGLDSEPTDPDPLTCTKRAWGGDQPAPCSNKELTGYGGHIIVHNGGKGYVEGVELYRMGQTNVLGRYPIHFHVLGEDCSDCYFRHSSIHRSFYRCISIHGTNNVEVSQNVAYDVTGYCYYLEDGVEENNTFSYNLGAHIHTVGDLPVAQGQTTNLANESNKLTLPADVTASAFYITNVHNNVIGNAASGGWAGFAFPSLKRPIGLHAEANTKPSSKTSLIIDGNTAHSTGFWWGHAAGFYFGGALYTDSQGKLEYNAGRDLKNGTRQPCLIDQCVEANNCNKSCPLQDRAYVRMMNSKAFLIPGVGTNSWHGRMEVKSYEAHDTGLAIESLSPGFWLDDMHAECRTGEKWSHPSTVKMNRVSGNGFFWYDTNQEHIITNSLFKNCGYRSNDYNQYNTNDDRGCIDTNNDNGCSSGSTVFGFLTHSDQFNPEVMQGTKNITYDNCGRRFKLHAFNKVETSVSGRLQNWLDVDGSASGLGEPVLIGSGQTAAGLWWHIEDDVVDDPQGPLKFIKKNNGQHRSLGHINIGFDGDQHSQVGNQVCSNGRGAPCEALGYVKHFGTYFKSDNGLPITAASDIAGPVGGFGWYMTFLAGSPKTITISQPEINPSSKLILGIPYPKGTTVTVTASVSNGCTANAYYSCSETFQQVDSPEAVRESDGNVYHMSVKGFLYVRIIQLPNDYIGNPTWSVPEMDTEGKWGAWYAIDRFSREDVTLLIKSANPVVTIEANCATQGGALSSYCQGVPTSWKPEVCDEGYEQVAYDKCCVIGDSSSCVYAS